MTASGNSCCWNCKAGLLIELCPDRAGFEFEDTRRARHWEHEFEDEDDVESRR